MPVLNFDQKSNERLISSVLAYLFNGSYTVPALGTNTTSCLVPLVGNDFGKNPKVQRSVPNNTNFPKRSASSLGYD